MAPHGWALTPFLLKGLRPPFVPALPWISHFPEMNVRTYVRGTDGEPGVWFFTLEAGRLAAVAGARLAYGLPYRWAAMRVRKVNGTIEYSSSRKWPLDRATLVFPVEIGNFPFKRQNSTGFSLRAFLGCIRFSSGAPPGFAQIEHEPWPLMRTARFSVSSRQNVIEGSGVSSTAGKSHAALLAGRGCAGRNGEGLPRVTSCCRFTFIQFKDRVSPKINRVR